MIPFSNLKGILLLLATWGAYFVWLWPHVLRHTPQGITSGWWIVWADWAAHFAYANVFAFRSPSDWFSVHPLFPWVSFQYPFAADMISGLLIRAGLDHVTAFVVPSLITSLFFLVVIFIFYRRLLTSDQQAFAAVSVFLTSGGLGFLFFLMDFRASPGWSTLLFPPRAYTHLPEHDVDWINIVGSELLPQRSFLLGFPLALLIVHSLRIWLREGFERTSYKKLILLGCLCSLLLFIHMHSYLALIIICAVFFLFSSKAFKQWLVFASAAAIPSFLFYFALFHGVASRDFFNWYPGWMTHPDLRKNISFFYFWWLNWGFFLPLAILGSVRMKLYKEPLVVAGCVLFVLSNLFRFQPWIWDNSKLLSWSYLFLAIPVVAYLSELAKHPLLPRAASVLLFVVVIGSGSLDLWRGLHTDKLSHLMWKNEEVALAEEFKKISKPPDRVLTSDKPPQWVSGLSGRQVLLGYRGWLSSYGLDYDPVIRDVSALYSSSNETERERLLKKYNLAFVVVGPNEIADFQADEAFFARKFPKVLERAGYRIYKVN